MPCFVAVYDAFELRKRTQVVRCLRGSVCRTAPQLRYHASPLFYLGFCRSLVRLKLRLFDGAPPRPLFAQMDAAWIFGSFGLFGVESLSVSFHGKRSVPSLDQPAKGTFESVPGKNSHRERPHEANQHHVIRLGCCTSRGGCIRLHSERGRSLHRRPQTLRTCLSSAPFLHF